MNNNIMMSVPSECMFHHGRLTADQVLLAIIATLTSDKQTGDLDGALLAVPCDALFHLSRSTDRNRFMMAINRLSAANSIVYNCINNTVIIHPNANDQADKYIRQYNQVFGFDDHTTSFKGQYCDASGLSVYLIETAEIFNEYEKVFLDIYFQEQYEDEEIVRDELQSSVRHAHGGNVSDYADIVRFHETVTKFHKLGILEEHEHSIIVPPWLLWIQDGRADIDVMVYG